MQLDVALYFAYTATVLGTVAASNDTRHETRWSIRMAESIMSRRQGIMTGQGGSSELLQAGITQRALTRLSEQYHSSHAGSEAARYIRDSAMSVAPFVSNASQDAFGYPLDRLSNGNALMAASQAGGKNTTMLEDAVSALRQSIDLEPRNQYGGLWYYIYPELSYLDGMASLGPFYAEYSLKHDRHVNTTGLQDMLKQFKLLWQHTRNDTTGLLVHGYDASKTRPWADPVTGASPIVWGRSLGWYFMALLDTLEVLQMGPQTKTAREGHELRHMFRSLASAVVDAVDPETGAWWQVVDQGTRAGNYIESSVSAMFSYGLLKGARLGLLHSNVSEVGLRAQQYLTDTFVVHNANGTLGWNGTVSVCSLNSTATYEYYTEQPLLYNSVLGSASYVLASLESERLGA